MYLFEGFFGVFLYTGDFRWVSKSFIVIRRYEDSMLENPFLFEKTIDILYLDNTFNDPHFLFPSQVLQHR